MHRADPKLRRALALAVVGTLLLGALGWWWLQEWLDGLADLPIAAAKGQLLVALAGCLSLLCLCLLALSIYFWRLGAQVVGQGQFPLPGARVARDVRMVTGEAARRYGRRAAILRRGAAGGLPVRRDTRVARLSGPGNVRTLKGPPR